MKTFFLLIFLVSKVLCENFTENGEHLKRFPRSVSCGVVGKNVGLIVNGDTTQKGDYPWYKNLFDFF
jgi:hypothetical protein